MKTDAIEKINEIWDEFGIREMMDANPRVTERLASAIENQHEQDQQQIAVKDEALEFYSKPEHWSIDGTFFGADDENRRTDGGQRARSALTTADSGKLENLLTLTRETRQLLAALNLVPVDREKLRELEWGNLGSECPVCQAPRDIGHNSGCWLSALLNS